MEEEKESEQNKKIRRFQGKKQKTAEGKKNSKSYKE